MDTKTLERQNRILHNLSRLPRMMVHIHGRDNISEFLLHELCSKPCFNLRKAAYFVDNPDFNCLRGIAGFTDEHAYNNEEIWKNADSFSQHMQEVEFNKQVRSIEHNNINGNDHKQKILNEVAQKLGFGASENFSWKMRHDNHGILMYEKNDPSDPIIESHIIDGISLLSFCPIF